MCFMVLCDPKPFVTYVHQKCNSNILLNTLYFLQSWLSGNLTVMTRLQDTLHGQEIIRHVAINTHYFSLRIADF